MVFITPGSVEYAGPGSQESPSALLPQLRGRPVSFNNGIEIGSNSDTRKSESVRRKSILGEELVLAHVCVGVKCEVDAIFSIGTSQDSRNRNLKASRPLSI